MPSANEAIAQYGAKQREFNTRQGAAIDGIVADLKKHMDLILELQNSPGPISDENQVTLDELVASGESLTSRLEALDAQTPPTVPPNPPTPA